MADCYLCGISLTAFGATRCNTEDCYLRAIAARDKRIAELESWQTEVRITAKIGGNIFEAIGIADAGLRSSSGDT
jgi:hypothetical protein